MKCIGNQNVLISNSPFSLVISVSGFAVVVGLFAFLMFLGDPSIAKLPRPIPSLPEEKAPAVSVNAEPIEVEGLGETPEKAVLNAKVSALEYEVGLWIAADTQVNDFVLIRQEIRASVQGYVSQTKVISNDPTADGLWKAKIKCVVRFDELRNHLIHHLGDMRDKFGHRRVVVCYPEIVGDEGRRKGTHELVICLEDALLSRGFRVFKRSFAQAQYRAIVERMKDVLLPPLFEEVFQGSEVNSFMIFVNLAFREDQGVHKLKVNATARNYGRRFVNLPSEFISVPRLDSLYAWEKGAKICAETMIPALFQKLMEQVSRYGTGQEYLFFFSGFGTQDQKALENILAQLKARKILLWKGTLSSVDEMFTADLSAEEDPVLSIHKAMMEGGLENHWYRLDNLLVFVKGSDLVWYLRRYRGEIQKVLVFAALAAILFVFRALKKMTDARKRGTALTSGG